MLGSLKLAAAAVSLWRIYNYGTQGIFHDIYNETCL